MLKFRFDSTDLSTVLSDSSVSDAMNAIIRLDLPEDMYMLKMSTAATWGDSYAALSPTNYDSFNQLLD